MKLELYELRVFIRLQRRLREAAARLAASVAVPAGAAL
jgi:hypothetical protein